MRHFTARRLALAALVPALFVLSVIPGCSNEGEGERCGDSYGIANNDDCQSGLTCTTVQMRVGSADAINRCCYTDHVSDSRCTITTGTSATGTTDDAGTGTTDDAGTGTTDDAGTAMSSAGGAATSEAGAGGSPSVTEAGSGGA